MIRQIYADEIDLLEPGTYEFAAEAKLPGKFNYAVFRDKFQKLISSGMGCVFVAEKNKVVIGALGGVHYNDLFTNDKVAVECFWFVSPEYRGTSDAIRLVKAFESWAKSLGCARCAMIHLEHLNNDRLERIYKGLGYSCVERNYIKPIQ